MRCRLIGLTMVTHLVIGVLACVLLIAAIFFFHGVLGWVLMGVAALLGLIALFWGEWRTYRERSGTAFPGDRGA